MARKKFLVDIDVDCSYYHNSCNPYYNLNAAEARLVVRRFCKAKVAGSSPASGSGKYALH